MDDLKRISNLLYAPGEVMPGLEMSLEEACARGAAAALFDAMPFCAVRDWVWIDLIVPESIRETLQASGQQPVMVYAGHVLYDSARRFEAGDWVRTTQLVEFADECIFRTRNTRYVLLGRAFARALSSLLSSVSYGRRLGMAEGGHGSSS